MRATLLLATILTACVDQPNDDLEKARATIQAECGDAPTAPGWSIANETINGYKVVVMGPADYAGIAAWRADLETYTACVQGYAH